MPSPPSFPGDEGTPNAQSIERDFENDFSTTESSPSSTPQSIPHKRLAVSAEPEPSRRLFDDAIVTGPLNKRKTQKRRHVDKQNEPEYPKRQRSLRDRSNNPLIYDCRYHPSDDVLRPFQAARLKGKTLNGKRDYESSEDSHPEYYDDSSDEDEHDFPAISPSVAVPRASCLSNSSRRRSLRNSGRRSIPNYDMKLHPDYDGVFRPSTIIAASKRRSKGRESHTTVSAPDDHQSGIKGKESTHLPSPDKGQGASRKSSLSAMQSIASSPSSLHYQGASPIPDAVTNSPTILVNTSIVPCPKNNVEPLRPSRSPQLDPLQKTLNWDGQFNAITVQTDDIGHAITRNEASRASNLQIHSGSQDPSNVKASNFNTLTSLERRLYVLQKGAPADGDVLPHSWQDVEQNLRDWGDVTVYSVNRNMDWLKAYYEDIREGVEAYWNSESEPKNSKAWTFYHSEDFNIFDEKRGVKNWRHHKDSIFHQPSIGPEFVELFEAADTEDEESRKDIDDGSANQDKTDLGATQVTTSPSVPTEKPFSIFEDGANGQAFDNCEDETELTRQRVAEQFLLDTLQDHAQQPEDVNEGIEDVTKWLMFPDPDSSEHRTNEDALANLVPLVRHHINVENPDHVGLRKRYQPPSEAFQSSAMTLKANVTDPVHTPEDTKIHHHCGNMGATPSRRALFYRSSGLSRTSPTSAAG